MGCKRLSTDAEIEAKCHEVLAAGLKLNYENIRAFGISSRKDRIVAIIHDVRIEVGLWVRRKKPRPQSELPIARIAKRIAAAKRLRDWDIRTASGPDPEQSREDFARKAAEARRSR